jgi:hypothetical protein
MAETTSSPQGAAPAPEPTPTPPAAAPAPVGPTNGLAIAALIVGIIAVITGWIPFWGVLVGGAAVVLGILGLRKINGKGMAIAGLVTGGLGALWGLLTTALFVIALVAGATVIDRAQQAVDEQNQQTQVLLDSRKDFARGETANFGDTFEVKVNSVQTNFNPGEYYAAEEGKQFLVVNVTVKNISDESEYVSPFTFSIVENGMTMDNSLAPVNDQLESGDIAADASVTGNLIYEVTANASDLKLSYELTVFDQSYETRELTYTLAI